MKKKYTFQYTDTKAIALLVLSGLAITLTLIPIIVYNVHENVVLFTMMVLIAFPITVLALKGLVIKQGEASLYVDRVNVILNKKEYDIPFSTIKSYSLENTQTNKLVIKTDKYRISIPVNEKFADYEDAARFFSDFDKSLKHYMKTGSGDIKRSKHFFITEDATKLLVVFSIFFVTTMLYIMTNKDMSLIKSSILTLLFIVMWGIHFREKVKYEKETPAALYDHNESVLLPFVKSNLKSILIVLFLGILLLLSVTIVPSILRHNSIDEYIKHDYSDYSNSIETAAIDFVNSITLPPYDSIDPNKMSENGRDTYFMLAMESHNQNAVLAMLNKGIELNTPYKDISTPLMLALENNDFNVANVLLDKGSKLDHIIVYDKYEPETLYTYFYNDEEKYSWLLQHDINYENKRMISMTLGELDYDRRDAFVSKLHRQLDALKNRDNYAQDMFEFTTVYLKADDQDLVVEKYLTGEMDFIHKYDQIRIREKRLQDPQYELSEQDEQTLLHAYKSGNRDAALDLACLYRDKKQYDQAIIWFKNAVGSDRYATAEFYLAYMYSNNLHDDKNAIKYYLLAAKKKNLVAVVRLLEDYPEVNSDIHNDISLLQYPSLLTLQKTAPTNANDALALSEHYLDTTDDKRALYWCKKAMSIGNASEIKEATFNIARLYYKKGQYKKAIVTFKSVQDMEYAVQNVAYIYEVIKDYHNAIKWYKKAWEKGYQDVGGDLGLLYEKTKAYPKAIKWYKKAFDKGDVESGYSLVSLYKKLNETDNAIVWYKKLFEVESNESYKIEILYKIAFLYHKKGDDLTAAAYYIVPIDIRYVKNDALTFLKSTWKIDEATIKKAYELQKSRIPNPYTGGID